MALVATAFTGIEIGAGVRAQSGSSETPVPELTLTVVLVAATEATWPGGHRNRVAAVERGITPAFGYRLDKTNEPNKRKNLNKPYKLNKPKELKKPNGLKD